MKVQLNTDSHIQGDAALAEYVESFLADSLSRYRGRITRVEVHLRDANADKGGDADKHCLLEARLEGRPPVAVSDDAGNVHDALHGAARKLERLLDKSLGKLAQ